LEYDDVVFALGSVTNFYDIPNLAETAVAMKSLGDAIRLRNLLIERLEEADGECAGSRWQLDLMRVSLCGYLI
jgi:NADH dehydrogenase